MSTHTRPLSVRAVALASLLGLLAPLLITMSLSSSADAVPSGGQAHVGLGDLPVNEVGGSNSWNGSFNLVTNTGETIISYCIQRGANYPSKTGQVQVGDIPAARGVSDTDRQALSYALWKYGSTTDPITAAAMSSIAHVHTNDRGQEGVPNQRDFWQFGGDPSQGLAGVVYGSPAWPNGWGDQVKARSIQIWNEALNQRGPWNVIVDIEDDQLPYRTTITVRSASGAGIANLPVQLTGHNTSIPGSGTTNSNGQIVLYADPTNPTNPIRIDASVTGPGYYRVFQAGTTQATVTSGGNAPYSGTDVGEVTLGQARVAKVTNNPAYQSGHGAVFELHRGNANGPVVGTLTVGPDGLSNVIDNLEAGTYTAVEVFAPEGQVLDPTPITVQVQPGQDTPINADNEVLEEGEITFQKLDDETEELVEGATIQIAYDSDNNGTYETVIGEYQSELTPTTIDGLRAGRYRVREVSPPDGYTLPEPDVRDQFVELTYGNQTRPGDNVLAVDVDFRNKVPLIHTQVMTTPVEDDPATPDVDESAPAEPSNFMTLEPGGVLTFADQVVLENVASTTNGTITANLYGPFEMIEDIVCDDDTLFATQSWQVTGSGTFMSPVFTVDESGVYTFVETWEGEDGASASHECGLETETVSVPGLSTQVSSNNVTFGEPITDTALVTSVPEGMAGVITADLYGPFASVEDIVCDENTLFASQDFEVVGSGVFESPEFLVDSLGVYTFVETWTEIVDVNYVDEDGDGFDDETGVRIPVDEDGDGIDDVTEEEIPAPRTPVTASHECGLTEETTVVQPTLATQVSEANVTVGEPITDTALVEGVPEGMAGVITADLYGPFESVEDIVCDEDTLFATEAWEVTGSGEFVSPEFTLEEMGVYTFVETWTKVDPDEPEYVDEDGDGIDDNTGEEIPVEDDPVVFTATHECGLTEETTVVHPELTTEVSNQKITAGDSVYDTSILTGVPEGVEGTVTFNLYGPYDSIDDAVCDETMLVDTVTADTVGSGETDSPEVAVSEPGVYTFVASWESDDGLFVATHDCGMEAETFTVEPNPVPDQGGGGGLLARTGSTVFPLVALAALSVGLGSAVLVVRRRKGLAGE